MQVPSGAKHIRGKSSLFSRISKNFLEFTLNVFGIFAVFVCKFKVDVQIKMSGIEMF